MHLWSLIPYKVLFFIFQAKHTVRNVAKRLGRNHSCWKGVCRKETPCCAEVLIPGFSGWVPSPSLGGGKCLVRGEKPPPNWYLMYEKGKSPVLALLQRQRVYIPSSKPWIETLPLTHFMPRSSQGLSLQSVDAFKALCLKSHVNICMPLISKSTH